MELIDRNVLIEKLDGIWACNDMVFEPDDCCDIISDCKSCKWRETKEAIKRIVLNMKAIDAVPVVRCSDCKYWDQLEPDHPYGYCMAAKHGCVTSNWDIGIYRKQRYDFFCADGERQEATDAST